MDFLETIVALLAAHLVADFLFQPAWIARAKRETWWGLILHVVIVLAASTLLLGNCRWQVLAVIGVSHLILDALKTFGLPRVMSAPDGAWPFALHQLAHIGFILLVASVWPTLFARGWWMSPADWSVPSNFQITAQIASTHRISDCYMSVLVLTSGLILCVPAGGILIGLLTNGMIDDVDVAPSATAASSGDFLSEQDEAKIGDILKGLPNGGRYIGWLERILVMLFVLSGQPQGIGFLIATKSILRFGDIKNWHQRAATEYVIIGTFLSFAWAMLIAGLTQHALQIWLPPKTDASAVVSEAVKDRLAIEVAPKGQANSDSMPC